MVGQKARSCAQLHIVFNVLSSSGLPVTPPLALTHKHPKADAAILFPSASAMVAFKTWLLGNAPGAQIGAAG